MSTDAAPPGWYADPMGRHELRWFDGQRWTDQVSDGGVPSLDPLTGGGAPQSAAGADPGAASAPASQPEPSVAAQASHEQYGAPPTSPGYIPPVPPGHPGAAWPSGPKRGRSWLPWAIAGAIVVVGAVAGIVLLTGDDDDDGGGDEAATTTVADDGSETTTTGGEAGEDYPGFIVENFMDACTAGGAAADVCQCSLDALEENFTLEEFIEIDEQMAEGALPDEVLDLLEHCF